MNIDMDGISKNELLVMRIFWKEGRPLSKPEIMGLLGENSWTNSYIHRVLRRLITKKLLKVVGKVQLSNKYSRQFLPTVSESQFFMAQIKNNAAVTKKDLSGLMAFMFDSGNKKDVIDTLEEMLRKVKDVD